MFYDLQRLRLQAGGRIQKKATEIYLDPHDMKRIAKISENLKSLEDDQLDVIRKILKGMPIWTDFLDGVKGIGPTLAGVLISELDIDEASSVSKMWRHCGLGVVDGKAERRVKGQQLAYNAFLKTKVIGVLGPSFLRAMVRRCNVHKADPKEKDRTIELEKSRASLACGDCKFDGYAKVFADYKHRLNNKDWGKSDGHRHNASIRFMVKRFLQDLYVAWRTLEGLPVRPPYAEEYLGKEKHQ